MVKRFHGRVALVTGCASGIGRVTAQVFAREGARIVVSTDSNIQGGEETVRLISAAGGEATFIKCDVSKAVEVHLHPSGGQIHVNQYLHDTMGTSRSSARQAA